MLEFDSRGRWIHVATLDRSMIFSILNNELEIGIPLKDINAQFWNFLMSYVVETDGVYVEILALAVET